MRYYENGFDHKPGPVVTAGQPKELQMFHWGLVPYWAKEKESIRPRTLNCISEEMYDKPAFKDAIANGQRCLVPASGFFEWKWIDEKGKKKIPHYISLKNQPLFSMAGIYSKWKDRSTGEYYYSYSVLTTEANALMQEIHNSKKRMPVIIPRDYEKDWLNPNLTKEDVLALCRPLDTTLMKAHPISKLITTNKGLEANVPEVLKEFNYEDDQPKLF